MCRCSVAAGGAVSVVTVVAVGAVSVEEVGRVSGDVGDAVRVVGGVWAHPFSSTIKAIIRIRRSDRFTEREIGFMSQELPPLRNVVDDRVCNSGLAP